jgi:hypothetical protein
VIGVERVWLRNKNTGGYFHCPEAAVEHWRGLGWEPSDPPEPVNLATAERVGWETHPAPPPAESDVAPAADLETEAPTKPARGGQSKES